VIPFGRTVDRPQAAVTVAGRYLGRERPLSAVLAVPVASAFLGTFLATSLLPTIVVGPALLVALRAPILRVRGTVRPR